MLTGNKSMFETPILLIAFNRPNHTRQVWDAIKKQRPKFIFVFQDGVREGNHSDKEKCAAVRAVFDEPLDWDCDLKTFYSDVNMGCGRGPAAAITWFFENVEQGIIFEDDCLPHPLFFSFCEQLLALYKNDQQISFIGGTSFISKGNDISSYYLSCGHHGTWGWATWKRTWMSFDYSLTDMTEIEFEETINSYFSNKRVLEYWLNIFRNVKKNRFGESCWDYQFYFSTWLKGQLAVIPYNNYITNIGSDVDATHTFGVNKLLNVPIKIEQTDLIHPTTIKQDKKKDLRFQKEFIQPYNFGIKGLFRLPYRINKRIKNYLGIKSWRNLKKC